MKDCLTKDDILNYIEKEDCKEVLDELHFAIDINRKKELLSYLEPDDLDDLSADSIVREIYDVNGLEVVKVLFTYHEGARGYIPQLTSLNRLMRRYIEKYYKKMSVKELSRRTGVHPEAVSKIIREIRVNKALSKQEKLF